jgi:ATP/maltotriose-dependent transcriptional regulator MalT
MPPDHALLTEAEALVQQGAFDLLAARLAGLSPPQLARYPQLLRAQGHLYWRDGNIASAVASVEQARLLATQQQAWPLAAYSALDIARWQQEQGEIVLARAYCDSAEHYARDHEEADLALEAHLALAFGQLFPDLGRNEQATGWASRALEIFEQLGDAAGQVHALCCLTVAAMNRAHLLEARGHAARALRLYQVADLGETCYLELLCHRARLAYYEGETEVGLAVVQRAGPILARHAGSREALQLMMIESALLGQGGQMAAALHVLEIALHSAEQAGHSTLLAWLMVERNWLEVLAGGSPAAARGDLLRAASLQDPALQRRVTLQLAVLDLLERRWADAAARLEQAVERFQDSGEALAAYGAQLYLAAAWLGSGDRQALRQELSAALGWAEAAGCDGFPVCWHPEIIARVCIEALRVGVRPRQSEVMIVRRLGDMAVPGLMRLLGVARPEARQRAQSALGALGGDRILQAIEGLPNAPLRVVLTEHLREGRLAVRRFEALRGLLGGDSAAAGWQRLAIFGYYAGSELSRSEIAARLAMSEGAVKREIAVIRSAFGVPSSGGRDPGRDHVRERALAERFVLRKSGLSLAVNQAILTCHGCRR